MRLPVVRSCRISLEKPRYPHFANVLNQLLLHSRKLKLQGDGINDGDIIFAINDLVVIESHHLPKLTKWKPDLICLLAKKFHSLFHKASRHGFKACMKTAAELNRDNKELEILADAKTTWGDILHSWELEAKKEIKSEIHTDFSAEDFLGTDKVKISPFSSDIDEPPIVLTCQGKCALVSWILIWCFLVQASTTSGIKRKWGSANIPSPKKIKFNESLVSLKPRAPKDVQCAFYGIERLDIPWTSRIVWPSCSKVRSCRLLHIFFSCSPPTIDAKLTLFWYDSQGCIQANSINIIQELPLLAVMIRIFEDFPLGMWGYTPINIWTKDENQRKVPYRHNKNPVGSFQIISRWTFTADTSKKKLKVQTATASITTLNARRSCCLSKWATQLQPLTSIDEHSEDEELDNGQSGDTLFLKSAWPETKRCKEPEVIIEAYKCTKELLGMESQSVTDHLPVLINSQALAYSSTEIIHCLVKSTTMDGFHVQLWMLLKKLQPIHVLDPKAFGKPFGTPFAVSLPLLRYLSID